MTKTIQIAVTQMTCDADRSSNLNKALTLIEKAAHQGAQIICLQELFESLYFCQDNDTQHFKLAQPIPSTTTESLSQAAAKHGIVLVASLFEKDQDQYYNTAVVFDADGKLLGKYRKLHIPDDLENHYSELFYFKPGNLGAPIFNTRFGKVGVLVCWDQWYPEAARAMAEQGAQIIFYPTAIGWPQGQRNEKIGAIEKNAWSTMQRSHAIANGVFVAAANRTGIEDQIDFWGGSFICDPFGEVLCEASPDEESVLMASCDLDRINQVREDWPFLKCRRFQIQLT